MVRYHADDFMGGFAVQYFSNEGIGTLLAESGLADGIRPVEQQVIENVQDRIELCPFTGIKRFAYALDRCLHGALRGCVDDRSTACARQACSDAVQHTSHAGTQAAPGCARATVTVWKEGFQKASFRWFGSHAGGVPDQRANAGKDLLQARW